MTIPARDRAFTLVELLVVIGVLLLLLTISIGLGPRLLESRREAVASQLLDTLDRALEEYTVAARRATVRGDEEHIRFWADDVPVNPDTADVRARFGNSPDARVNGPDGSRYLKRPDAAIFIRQARGVGAIDDIIAGIPERFVESIYGNPASSGGPSGPSGPGNPGSVPSGAASAATSILDPWGNRILFVHPDNIVAQRLYGRCVGNRPYFLSAGPDGVYGLSSDLDDAAFARASSSSGPGLRAFLEASLSDNITSYPADAPDTSDAGFSLRNDR